MSNAMKYPRGSEWRRWDLQVHTPHSYLNNGFGADFSAYAKTLLERAVAEDIAAIGVTDYFCIEGYKALRALIDDDAALEALVGSEVAEAARQILLLPNIEFRSSVVIQRDGADARVNFHVIFSDRVSPKDIEEHFLQNLRFVHESTPDQHDEMRPLTLANLIDLGRTTKAAHPPFRDDTDIFVGMKVAVVNHEIVSEVLDNNRSRFGGKWLFVLPADEDLSDVAWNGQGHQVRKVFVQKANMFFSSNEGTREFGLGLKHESVDEFVKEFKSKKPCIHGSDAHTYPALFAPDGERYCWIKADPTFEGLRQLLHEPEDRVWIGDRPRSLRHLGKNPTLYFSTLELSAIKPLPTEKWFSGVTPFNHGLIAIIGKKGSGKSALADILALLGGSRAYEHFSFLERHRFLAPKMNLGAHFHGELRWHGGDVMEATLDHKVDASTPERVKYIPQRYLEEICSSLNDGGSGEFDKELEEVIFSHVDKADRLGKDSLPELLDYRNSEKDASADQIIREVAELNRKIVALEAKVTAENRTRVAGLIAQRKRELAALEAAKPAEVVAPEEDEQTRAANDAIRTELDTIVHEIEALDDQTAEAEKQLAVLTQRVTACDRLIARIANLHRAVDSFYEESAADSELLGINIRTVVRLEVDEKPVTTLQTAAQGEAEPLRLLLDKDAANSLSLQKRTASANALATRRRLDEPNRKHQEYLQQLTLWNQQREQLIGTPEVAASLEGLKAELQALDALPGEIAALEGSRLERVKEIYGVKEALLADYKHLYHPVQEFIDTHVVSREIHALKFSASVAVDDLADRILGMINQSRKGSFQGEQGSQRMIELIAESEFSTVEGVVAFVARVNELMKRDDRDGSVEERRLSDQMVQRVSPEDFYHYLYGLTYLRPRFSLLWLDKPLDQLSPGERGTLLLVFYLLIDRREIPLIIDQPEENLDNETVTALLVPAIKYAKERRQIVIVTHNPNLAVVCDAEQIIHSSIDKTDGNRVTYTSGSIEDPVINQYIIDVLEGTKPAFDLRDRKYELLDRV